MITYCLGAARQKRAYFAKMRGEAIFLDSLEVIYCADGNGVSCFAIGDVPFASFPAEQYLKYRRALLAESKTELLDSLRIKRDTPLGKLSPAQVRCVQFIEKTGGDARKPIVVDLDGTKYSRKNARALRTLLSLCREAYVCVSDERFIPRKTSAKIMRFGSALRARRPRFYPAKRLKNIGAKKIAVF